MRDLRTRIAQRHGIDLSQQQVQELAARRLEAILDPRTVKPALLEELRRSAKTEAESAAPGTVDAYEFTETTIYESHRGLIRFFRRLLNPVLMLFVNPSPIARALSAQSTINVEAATRAADQDRRLREWNALLYEIVQRLVTEVARASVEVQALTARVESLSARVDFNDKRVRSLETPPPVPSRSSSRPVEAPHVPHAAISTGAAPTGASPNPGAPTGTGTDGSESGEARRRRRRRRGRRPGWGEGTPGSGPGGQQTGASSDGGADEEEGDAEEPAQLAAEPPDHRAPDGQAQAPVAVEPAAAADSGSTDASPTSSEPSTPDR